ncbi:ubiquinone biosynthesis protein COQ9, mitochondrial isoform X1 [Aethina tumida]|uniref:ubiquinone biosynthesis protein COQ9, mitochondrial isoform X1 n=1 Tax=Aethina tumida TaxID=116153 RepID=UPI002147FD7E|nr:ubiquinone biosynthesis protein COQ9, mitochondrial isoform X1 [Aethina tumida]
MSLATLLTAVRINFRSSCNLRSTIRLISNQSANPEPNDSYEDDVKEKILCASLKFVPELGWTKEALSAGAQTVGYPGVAHGIFQSGGGDLVHYFQLSSNKKLVDILKKFQGEHANDPIPPAQFVERACKERLQMIVPYLQKWPQAIAIMSLPPNVPNALAALLTMVDDICYYAGDRSVDFNWYLRRIGIAGVYKATELYLIQDKSKDHEETWKFLNRRLIEAVQLHDLISKSDVASQGAKDVAASAFVTARNILGLNWNR